MRIAFLHLTMGLTDRGSERVVAQLATALSNRHQVLVIQAGPVSPQAYQVKRVYPLKQAPETAPAHLLSKLLFRLQLDPNSRAVVQFTSAALSPLSRFAPDVIVAINGPLQVRILRGRTPWAKIVTFGHAGIGYHDLATLSERPDLFIALTPTAKVWADQHARSHTRVVYIPNPVLTARAKPRALSLQQPTVICVGALSKYKNITQVISAVRLTHVSLLLIGDGEERESIESELSTLPNDFCWVKHVPPAEIASYYAAGSAFCFVPDSQEAFGLVYLEAMAQGLPVVASYDQIRRDLIGQQGIYVDPCNVQDIAMGINAAIQLGKLDYSAELKPYELKTVVSQIDKELHDLIH